jgi:glucose/arabinose dehydrogenase
MMGLIALAAFASVQQITTTSGTVPINFVRGTLSGGGFATVAPSALEVGPDGRLYVADMNGRIQALTLDANKNITGVQQVTTNANLQEVFGIAFDPNDASSPPTIYVTNTVSGFGDASPAPASGNPGSYAGKITRISGPTYATRTDIITGLPVSNSGHEANGLAFGPDGRLYIAQGGTTNAGIVNPGGGLFQRPEPPTGGAILVANIHASGFNGNITYSPANIYSDSVQQTGGDVEVYAPGFRNPYDLAWHSNGHLYATDNGPNGGYGPPSVTCVSQGTDAAALDELNLVEEGKYYGHPNRNRGATDARQCTYHPGTEPSNGQYTGPIAANLPASSNGLVEYKLPLFGGQMQGDLLYVSWVENTLHRVKLSADGRSVLEDTMLASGLQNALDVAVGPDGTIYVAEYGAGRITYFRPDETPVSSISVTGVQPVAGSINGGQQVTITGTNFTTTAETTVSFDGAAATNVKVENSTTIKATTPAGAGGPADVTVTNSVGTHTLVGGYTYAIGGGTIPPVANAGEDITTPIAHIDHAHVTLDGRGSYDPDGYIVSYEWREGTTILSTNYLDSVQMYEGQHTVTLTVTDNDGLTHSDVVRIIVTATAENPKLYFCNDVNGDRVNNVADLGLVAQAYGKRFTVSGYQPLYNRLKDANGDRVINVADLGVTASLYGACPLVDQMIRDATAAMESVVPPPSTTGIPNIGFQDIRNARALGYVQVTPFIPQQGAHYMRNGGIDGQDAVMDLLYPESLLYEPSPSTPGGWRLGAPMYVVPYNLTIPQGGTGGIPPDGFPGNEDAWHYHKHLCVWGWNGSGYTLVQENVPQATCLARPGNPVWTEYAGWLLHIWNFKVNPVGRFVENSPTFVGGQ